MLESFEEPSGPPEATLKRRAQSYTDFHHATRAVLDKRKTPEREKPIADALQLESGKNEEANISDDIDFAEWYQELEHELLDSSHGDYMYALASASKFQILISYSTELTRGSSRGPSLI